MKPVKLGVVGMKHGLAHVQNIGRLPGAALAAICSSGRNGSRIALAKERHARYYTNVVEMLESENLDGVIISVPNDQNPKVVEECAKRGIHVLIEKPVADSMDAAEKIAISIKKHNIKALVGHHRRFSPSVRALKEAIDEGQIGTVVGISVLWAVKKPDSYFGQEGARTWQARLRRGGGPLLINAIHDIDTLRYIFGDIRDIRGLASNRIRGLEVEDTAAACIEFDSGPLATVLVTDASSSPLSYEYTVGENPFFPTFEGNCYFIFGTNGTLTFPRLQKFFHVGAQEWGSSIAATSCGINVEREDPLFLELTHFCRLIRGVEEAISSVDDAKKSLDAVLRIRDVWLRRGNRCPTS